MVGRVPVEGKDDLAVVRGGGKRREGKVQLLSAKSLPTSTSSSLPSFRPQSSGMTSQVRPYLHL